MYRLDREEFLRPRQVALWSMLGFQAGFINAFGFLACGRYVSHVTGFGTSFGLALGDQRLAFALEMLGFPVSFVLGSFMSGSITIARIERGLKPHFDKVMLILPMIILMLIFLGRYGLFGPFGEQLVLFHDFILLYFLSFLCGMQNGCFATLTRGQIRTTHLTGISTDIGTDLARLFFGRLQGEERRLTQMANFSRISTFIFFSLGSIVSVLVSRSLGYLALCVPFMTSVLVFFSMRWISFELDHKYQGSSQSSVKPVGSSHEKDSMVSMATPKAH